MRQSFLRSFIFAALILLVFVPINANAQKHFKHDSTYYSTYHQSFIPRLYVSKKNTSFTLPALASSTTDLKYKANNRTKGGVGLIYKFFSLDLGYDFDFLNPTDNDEKGETKGLNMQFHIYPRKWVIDAVGLFQKGFYLSTNDYFPGKPGSYTYRKDVKQDFVNIAAYRVRNADKFSYRAAMVQNEWQKKSAGSLLYGGQAYYGSLRGDSALVPKALENKFAQAGIKKVSFFSAGAGVGYAHTLVIDQHFFIMASLVGNLNLNFSTEEGSKKDNKTSVGPAAIYKASIGYNSDGWSISGNYAGNAYFTKGASSDDYYYMPSDNFRLVLEKKLGRR